MSISLRSMRYFNKALAHGSIAKAADELNIAASAVSSTIDQIEAQLQLKLINRFRSRGIVATASGKVMERKFAQLLDEFDAVIAEATHLKQSLKGELKIGYYAPIAPAFLPSILASLKGTELEITFRLEECDNIRVQEEFLAGGYDAILFVSDDAFPQIEYDVLIEAPAYCLISSEHSLSVQSSVQLKDLVGQQLIVLSRPVAVEYYHQLFAKTEQNPSTIAYANSTEMVRSMVGSGHGIAVLNMVPSTEVSYAGERLIALPISDPLLPLTLSVAYDKTNPRRIVSHFVEHCQNYFQNEGKCRHIVSQ